VTFLTPSVYPLTLQLGHRGTAKNGAPSLAARRASPIVKKAYSIRGFELCAPRLHRRAPVMHFAFGVCKKRDASQKLYGVKVFSATQPSALSSDAVETNFHGSAKVVRRCLKKQTIMHLSIFEPDGQGWSQLAELGIAFVLSALIGLEREYRQKSAGFRTYTVVGLAAALIMLVSKYGFTDILQPGRIVLDPSRVAAQIVTGIGFIGGGVIFMRKDLVRGLTTAAIVWLTAAVGMACGAGLPILAVAVTAGHFAIVFGFPEITRRLPRTAYNATQIRLTYQGGRGTLRNALATCTRRGFSVSDVAVDRTSDDSDSKNDVVSVGLVIQGRGDTQALVDALAIVDGALTVHASEVSESTDSLN
jgi:putative Mg2+ transporter-C (MgtC) family protein